MRKSIVQITLLPLLFIFWVLVSASPAYAIVDPLATPNNRFGIHIISPTHDESSPAAQLVNSSGGDWGYVTVLITGQDRDQNKWQSFFNDLRRRHLIPLVRIATQPQGNYWKVPQEGEETAWANFLDSLNWPTKNRYVIIYNEPNQGQEWEGKTDPRSYARVLDRTITALKNKHPDFFVLNAGLDASAPQKPPLYQDEASFLGEMEDEVPGIFSKLDGWVSHSYPNPGFAGSPGASGKGTVRTWLWEQTFLRSLGMTKILPVFITETGWKHAEGINFDKSLPTAETVGSYFQDAFQNAWNSSRIVAVTPFLLDYQDFPFDHFSFRKPTGKSESLKILGASYPQYYPHYQTILELPKLVGQPVQENKAALAHGSIYSSIVAGENYTIPLTFKNTGQSIWGDNNKVELRVVKGATELGISPVKLSGSKIEPGQEAKFNLEVKAPLGGSYPISLQLYINGQPFDQNPWDFTTEVKEPVILQIKTSLWGKKDSAGSYLLTIINEAIKNKVEVNINKEGVSEPLESRLLLPDYNFSFTLSKPFYKPKTIDMQVASGINQLNFGELQPDFLAAILKPKELWQLLPFSD